jgi:hypothetical protein
MISKVAATGTGRAASSTRWRRSGGCLLEKRVANRGSEMVGSDFLPKRKLRIACRGSICLVTTTVNACYLWFWMPVGEGEGGGLFCVANSPCWQNTRPMSPVIIKPKGATGRTEGEVGSEHIYTARVTILLWGFTDQAESSFSALQNWHFGFFSFSFLLFFQSRPTDRQVRR